MFLGRICDNVTNLLVCSKSLACSVCAVVYFGEGKVWQFSSNCNSHQKINPNNYNKKPQVFPAVENNN